MAETRNRVSNEQILEVLNALVKDVEELKTKTGFYNQPVMPPEKKNWNTDPGPWVKSTQTAQEQAAARDAYKGRLLESVSQDTYVPRTEE